MHSMRKLYVAGVVLLLAAGVMPVVRAAESKGDPNKSPARCGSADTPEKGIQGDVAPASGANCGLSFLSQVPGGGSVQGSGHCAYVRPPGLAPYTGSVIKAYDLSDPAHPRQTDEQPARGGSESMRAQTTADRAILVSGKGVYDISNCEKLVFKGDIPWPSLNATAGAYVAATNSHEIGISHDAK